ncbi:hypothetical protein K2173_004885 [Erythroxylum novogranatense]|uniref:Strictosidine synthase conserved region domain-containing protein n=1 Tax=Erythroxylum novogranatense TaxID=1862640 RepID=A0AAV8TDC5_9ROSI|nr:hypothetical protein K2173_004885 [Erythroxylum novogranatense]
MPRITSCSLATVAFSVVAPVFVAVIVYQLDSFDPAPFPLHEFTQPPLTAPAKNVRMLQGSEFVGFGKLQAPEDIAYDDKSGTIYTGCVDGWIKRVKLNDSVVGDSAVENLVNTGGRPLGVVLGPRNEVIVADANKGLLNISVDGAVEVLTNEAEGVEFKLTDAAVIAEDGTIYFTDASYKYNLHDHAQDVLGGKPYGRLISFDPITRKSKVLVRDLYFANGVEISPNQDYVVFCETPMRRCRKYYIQGKDKGRVESFIENLPGLPDNIHYDGQDHYWIALATEFDRFWDLMYKYPIIRKCLAIIMKYNRNYPIAKNSGVFVLDLEGKPTAHYQDPGLTLISTGVKIGNHLYCGSIVYPYIISLDLTKHPAIPI